MALARFADSCPDRELFVRPMFHGDLAASAHNEWTIMLYAWFLVTEPSPTTGKPVKAKTARSYASLMKGYLEFTYSFTLVHEGKRLKRLLDSLARDEPLGGVRRKRRAFRRRHLRRWWRLDSTRATDVNTVNRVAAIGVAWHTLARGGELAPGVSHAQWRWDVHPTRADLAFGARPDGERYAIVWLRPLKKKGATVQPKVPQYIAEHDGGGSDVFMLLQRLVAHDPVPDDELSRTPLFRQRVRTARSGYAWRHMTVAQLRRAVRNAAYDIGYRGRGEWGAHSPRIGGATDLAATGKTSELMLRAKGRWASDIGAIYSRLTTRALLAASRLMQKARGRDLEEVIPDFVQPA